MSVASAYQSLIEAATEFMENTPDQLVDLFLGGENSPFAADLSPADKIAYYESKFFNPDGSPNQIGRQEELARLGVADYIKTLGQMQKLHDLFSPPPNQGELG